MKKFLLPSFGRRKARKLRTFCQRDYDEKFSLVKIPNDGSLITPCPSEIWLEIGFGGGEHLLAQLAQNPTIHMIGCEPFINGVAKLLAHLPEEDQQRFHLWPDDVRQLLERIPSSYLSRVFILFPDPWPKARQHKRRLITFDFITQLMRTLKEGALFYVASDDPSYVQHIQDVLYVFPGLHLIQGPSSADTSTWFSRPHAWPSTRYEQKATDAGKPCAYMIFQKVKS